MPSIDDAAELGETFRPLASGDDACTSIEVVKLLSSGISTEKFSEVFQCDKVSKHGSPGRGLGGAAD